MTAVLDKNETGAKLISILGTILIRDADSISVSATFDELGMDSLDKIEMIMRLEETLNIHIDDNKFEHISSIADAINYLNALQQ